MVPCYQELCVKHYSSSSVWAGQAQSPWLVLPGPCSLPQFRTNRKGFFFSDIDCLENIELLFIVGTGVFFNDFLVLGTLSQRSGLSTALHSAWRRGPLTAGAVILQESALAGQGRHHPGGVSAPHPSVIQAQLIPYGLLQSNWTRSKKAP